MTSLVVRKVKSGGLLKLRLVQVQTGQKVIGGGPLKLERVQVILPCLRTAS